jgi:hypothetical protein
MDGYNYGPPRPLLAEGGHLRMRTCRLTNRCTGRLTIGSLRYRYGRQSSSAGELSR